MTAAWDARLRDDAAMQAAADRLPAEMAPLPPARAILFAGLWFDRTRTEIIGKDDLPDLIAARALVVWLLRSVGPPASYPEIGRALGGRHHTTIIHLHQRAIALRLRDRLFGDACRAVIARIRKGHHHG